jgi:UDP-glucose 4-epimerase
MKASWRGEFYESLTAQRVLVTGVTGFIGWHLSAGLVELGAEVHGLARTASAATVPAGVVPYAVDLTEQAQTRAVVAEIAPTLVFHLAGLVTARCTLDLLLPMFEHNLHASVNLMLAAHEQGARVVLAGSSETPREGQVPTSPYAAAKAATTLYAQLLGDAFGLQVIRVDIPMTYGPRQDQRKLIPYVLDALAHNTPPRLGSGEAAYDFLFVDDVIRGLLLSGVSPGLAGSEVLLRSGRLTQVREVVALLLEMTDSRVAPEYHTQPDNRLTGGASETTAARLLPGWHPQWTLREGMQATWRWYLAHGGNPSDGYAEPAAAR